MPKIKVKDQTGERPQTDGHTHTHTDTTKRIISPAMRSIKINGNLIDKEKPDTYLISKLQFIGSQHQDVIIQRQNCFCFYLVVWVKPSITIRVKPNVSHGIHNITAAEDPNPLIFYLFL